MSRIENWRDDPGLQVRAEYKRKFAFLPTLVDDKEKIWLKNYYTVYKIYGHGVLSGKFGDMNSHKDTIGNISEEEYVVRKLTDGF